jgi:glycosyltransferase involved in cell wall biosynthesis
MQAKSWSHSRGANMDAPTIGVALCTYNGERYVREQVRSIFAQTRLPDLLLACDDASHDGTVAALEELAAQAPFPVRIVRNSANLGFRRNFEQAIFECDADIIALADQDDWWCREKLEKVETAFVRDPSAAAVFSDAELVDESLSSMGRTLLEALSVDSAELHSARSGLPFAVLIRRNIVCGATVAFRAEWKVRLLPIPERALHDEWIGLVTAGHHALRFIPDPLIRYRQHAANEIGLRSRRWQQRLRGLFRPQRPDLERLLELMAALEQRLTTTGAGTAALRGVSAKRAHLERRLALPASRARRLGAVLTELSGGQYSRFAAGWRTALRDLFLAM